MYKIAHRRSGETWRPCGQQARKMKPWEAEAELGVKPRTMRVIAGVLGHPVLRPRLPRTAGARMALAALVWQAPSMNMEIGHPRIPATLQPDYLHDLGNGSFKYLELMKQFFCLIRKSASCNGSFRGSKESNGPVPQTANTQLCNNSRAFPNPMKPATNPLGILGPQIKNSWRGEKAPKLKSWLHLEPAPKSLSLRFLNYN